MLSRRTLLASASLAFPRVAASGIVVHASALKGGEQMKIPSFDS